jgi:starch synthase (maltosyl-transferring)
MALALDLAFQASPDHPWVTEHPEWFQHRPDGSIHYAENPPKKYQDIYPFDFESVAWRDLWQALLDVVLFWIGHGVKVFRVDNPHTKPFAFWEWLIAEVRASHPDTVFLAEAFTTPAVMERLAKIGFSQSYTYFTWRHSRFELEEYLRELTTKTIDYMRPNFWPNTPDILTEELQEGGHPAFASRAVLASMLCASWGVYGPAFELVEQVPIRKGSEEYLNSEKYQVRSWDLSEPTSLAPLLRRLNAIRRRHPALQSDRGLHFHKSDNDFVMCFSKRETDGSDAVLVVVNLDPNNPQSAWLDVDLAELGVPYESLYELRDELGDQSYVWRGAYNWVRLDPEHAPAHVFSITEVFAS